MSKGRVLSIQSHVAFGYVGGKAAVFPLQCLGFDVDVVNTVNFSNHTGYGRFGGSRTTAEELSQMFRALEENGLLKPSRLLTGYIAGAEALTTVAGLASKLRQRDPQLIYVLDPVLGDAGKLYVAPECVPIYQSMLPLATVITPNWFEVEVLTKINIVDMTSLKGALRVLHEQYGVPNIIISSMILKPWLKEALPDHIRPSNAEQDRADYLLCLCSTSSNTENPDDLSMVHAYAIPCVPGYFSGVGDLFSAMVLAHLEPTVSPADLEQLGTGQTPLSYATSMAVTKTHAVLSVTYEYSQSLPEDERLPTDDEKDKEDPERKIRRMKGRELRLVQAQDIIRSTSIEECRRMEPWTTFWKL
ncbi:Ribokinase-like protein [Gloeophyllum trabeum ATCC 11539]|uniref:pyridoxal kinase n=1 Tax=Gloeophyllum trabeum (strain ATCC 11539 / FP-39264 / Madison 617) TaxID=670483 RepID=S7Q875_GLOTA|nr:Ribokinase-like protein [Gloeophyllum trabeum ATCC 11539]EPQ56186.1 Ribokinase-like protein [Gloeophyllum trabeum ATCC 11539]